MAELSNEIYEYGNHDYKWQRRDRKKRKKSLEILNKKSSKNNCSSINSRKTFFIVKLIYKDKEYSFEIPANKYIGDPNEFKEIKEMCIKKYGVGIRILEISTK